MTLLPVAFLVDHVDVIPRSTASWEMLGTWFAGFTGLVVAFVALAPLLGERKRRKRRSQLVAAHLWVEATSVSNTFRTVSRMAAKLADYATSSTLLTRPTVDDCVRDIQQQVTALHRWKDAFSIDDVACLPLKVANNVLEALAQADNAIAALNFTVSGIGVVMKAEPFDPVVLSSTSNKRVREFFLWPSNHALGNELSIFAANRSVDLQAELRTLMRVRGERRHGALWRRILRLRMAGTALLHRCLRFASRR